MNKDVVEESQRLGLTTELVSRLLIRLKKGYQTTFTDVALNMESKVMREGQEML